MRIVRPSATTIRMFIYFIFNVFLILICLNGHHLNVSGFPSDQQSSSSPTTFDPEIPSSPSLLIVATNKLVKKLSVEATNSASTIYRHTDYSAVENITSLGIHVMNQYIFISDSSGNIRRITIKHAKKSSSHGSSSSLSSLTSSSSSSSGLTPSKTIFKGKNYSINHTSNLSIDWLNQKIYFVANNAQISRCDLHGDFYELLVEGFDEGSQPGRREVPSNLMVDPINGYLFYALTQTITSGIYRIDLNHFSKGHTVTHKATSEYILSEPTINVFTLDYEKQLIYYPKPSRNGSTAIISMKYDGKHPMNIREPEIMIKSQFGSHSSEFKGIVHYNQMFYWTNGKAFYKEERHPTTGQIFHNEFYLPGQYADDVLISVTIMFQGLQPTPRPHTAVENITALFTDTSGRAYWNKPSLPPGMGKGSWQHWKYELSIRPNVTNSSEVLRDQLIDNNSRISQLAPETEYIIKVRAYSLAGKGPWSAPFIGKTMKSASVPIATVIGEAPSKPEVKDVDSNHWIISWEGSNSNGAEMVHYELELKDISGDVWLPVYKGTQTSWSISGITEEREYQFKVRARTRFGESTWASDDNQKFWYTRRSGKSSSDFVVVAITMAFMIFAVLVGGVYYYVMHYRKLSCLNVRVVYLLIQFVPDMMR